MQIKIIFCLVCYTLFCGRLYSVENTSSSNVYILKGLFHEYYKIEEAARAIGLENPKVSYFVVQYWGSAVRPEFPRYKCDLQNVRVVVLADMEVKALGLYGRKALRDFVADGGGLMIIGGLFGLAQGECRGTFIDELIPVEAENSVVDWYQPPLIITRGEDDFINRSISFEKKPVVIWGYRFDKLKPGARVLVKAGDSSFLVTWTYKKGRVALLTGTCLGESKEGELAFWEWDQWVPLMKNVLAWLAMKEKE